MPKESRFTEQESDVLFLFFRIVNRVIPAALSPDWGLALLYKKFLAIRSWSVPTDAPPQSCFIRLFSEWLIYSKGIVRRIYAG